MSRISKTLGGFKSILTLLVFALITALIIIPSFLDTVDASIDRTRTGNNKSADGRAGKTLSHEAGIENYDIRIEKNDTVGELMTRFRNVSAPELADTRESFVRGEERLRTMVRSLKVEYSPDLRAPEVIAPSIWGDNLERLTAPSSAKRSEILRNFIKQNNELFGIRQDQADDLVVTADYNNPDGNMSFAHLEQQIDEIPVFRGEVKAGFTKDGQMIRVINNLAPRLDYDRVSKDFGDPADAVKAAAEDIRYEINADKLTPNEKESTDRRVAFGYGGSATTAEKMYFPTEPGVVRAAWRVLIWKPVSAYYVIVDGETGAVLWRKNITEDQTQSVTYGVYRNSTAYIDVADSPAPITPGPIDPTLGTQGAFISRVDMTLIGNEVPNVFNNLGWITDGGNTTDGNNVQSGLDRELPNADFPANPADIDPTGMATGSPNRVFSYAYNPLNPNGSTGDAPTPNTPTTCSPLGTNAVPTAYQQGVVTQLFYITNRYHDAMYLLGFNEVARNFQNDNFARGGTGSDRVSAQAQDCSGTDNANFSTPADGTRGQMQMYIFNDPTPDSDGDLDADVVIHELTHGTSNRLHNNAGGLTNNMSRGMGEGWSDFYAHAMLAESTDPINGVYTTGAYVTFNSFGLGTTNSYYGIRRFPKAVIAFTGGALNRPHNPLTFADLNSGCNLTDGAFAPAFTGTCDQVHNAGEIWSSALWEVRAKMVTRLGFIPGTTRVLQIVTDGMKLAPSNPTFIQERDAIISAASAISITPEAALDILDVREGFRLRGMGFSASVLTASPAVVTEAFDPPNVRTVDPFSVSDSTGDNDGFPEPGENVLLSVAVSNPNTGGAITGVQVNVNGGANVSYGTINDGQTVTMQIPYTVSGGATCGSMHQITINVSSTVGAQPPATRSFRLGAPVGGAPVSFTNSAAITIPLSGAGSPYPSTIAVSGLTGNKVMRVTLNGYHHEFEDDVDILLVGPGGQGFLMKSDVGGVTEQLTPITFSIADSGATLLPDATAIVDGTTYRPSNVGTTSDALPPPAPPGWSNPAPAGAATFTSVFGTASAGLNGNWSLYAFDDAGGDLGAIDGGWTITFEANDFACDVTAALVSVSGRVVNSAGRGLGGVKVTLAGPTTRRATTSTFGYFTFTDVPSLVQYTITPSAKRYSFTPQQVTPAGNVSGVVFVGTQ